MSAGKIVAVVVGALAALIGLALLIGGVALFVVNGTLKDESGFFESPSAAVSTSSYALTSTDVDLADQPGVSRWLPSGAAVLRLRAVPADSAALFMGIGRTERVDSYLSGVAHDVIVRFDGRSDQVEYRHVDGGPPSAPPEIQGFWVARAEGTGTQTLEWDVTSGNWTAVVMRSDASAGVSTDVTVGARVGFLIPIAIGLTVAGVVILGIAALLLILGFRTGQRAQPPESGVSQPPPAV